MNNLSLLYEISNKVENTQTYYGSISDINAEIDKQDFDITPGAIAISRINTSTFDFARLQFKETIPISIYFLTKGDTANNTESNISNDDQIQKCKYYARRWVKEFNEYKRKFDNAHTERSVYEQIQEIDVEYIYNVFDAELVGIMISFDLIPVMSESTCQDFVEPYSSSIGNGESLIYDNKGNSIRIGE